MNMPTKLFLSIRMKKNLERNWQYKAPDSLSQCRLGGMKELKNQGLCILAIRPKRFYL